jgi:hypothetical protein
MYLQLAEDRQLSRRRLFQRDPNKRNPVASVALAPGRALFLAMLNFNVDGLATKLARRNWSDLQSRWLKVGGNPKRLSEAINKGKGKKPKKINFLSKLKGKQLGEDVYLSEELSGEAKSKIIAASTAAGTAVGTVVPGIGNAAGAAAGASLGGLIVAIYPVIKQAAEDPAGEDPDKTPEPVADVPAGEDVSDPNATTETGGADTGATDQSFFTKYKTPLLIGGGLLAIGAIYMLTKKRK